MKRQIKKHLRDFIAIVVLVVLAFSVAGFIMAHQRLSLPGWVPLVGESFYTVKAEFTTAQAVMPGQGQTVNVAGVTVGDITGVELKDGKAVVTMRIEEKYAPVYRDATVLLRPRTTINDMFISMDVGTKEAGELKSGGTLTSANTKPNVNLDELLSALDADTRDYLVLLLNSGAQGLRGNAKSLNLTLRRLDPVSRNVRRIFTAIAERRRNLARLVHNLQLLTNEVGTRDRQLAELIDSSNAVFKSLASQEAALRESVRLLPDTLKAGTSALEKSDTLAKLMGPTLKNLQPGAKSLGPSLKELRAMVRKTEPVLREQIRPFVRDAKPVVDQLKPTARDLAKATPDATTAFQNLNELLNLLGYNPSGKEEGFLFWLAWFNHASASAFSMQDAQGAAMRGILMLRCPLDVELMRAVAEKPEFARVAILVNNLDLPSC